MQTNHPSGTRVALRANDKYLRVVLVSASWLVALGCSFGVPDAGKSESKAGTVFTGCSTAKGTISIESTAENLNLPLTRCYEYGYRYDRVGLIFCGGNSAKTLAEQRGLCAQVFLASAPEDVEGSYTTGNWVFGSPDDLSGSLDAFLKADLVDGFGWVAATRYTYPSGTEKSDPYSGTPGGVFKTSNPVLPKLAGENGTVHLDAQGLPLSSGAQLSFTADLSLSVSAASSSSGNNSGPGGGNGSGGSGSDLGANCRCTDSGASCMAAAQNATMQCADGNQGQCSCAAALTYACFYQHGCYAEAGCKTSVTQSQISVGCRQSLQQVAAYNGSCSAACP